MLEPIFAPQTEGRGNSSENPVQQQYRRLMLGGWPWAATLALFFFSSLSEAEPEPAARWTLWAITYVISILPLLNRVEWTDRHMWCLVLMLPFWMFAAVIYFVETLARMFRQDQPVTGEQIAILAAALAVFILSIAILFSHEILSCFGWYRRLIALLQAIGDELSARINAACKWPFVRLWSICKPLLVRIWSAILSNSRFFKLLAVTVACSQLWACTMGPDDSYYERPQVPRGGYRFGQGYVPAPTYPGMAHNYRSSSYAPRPSAPAYVPPPAPVEPAPSPAPAAQPSSPAAETTQGDDTNSILNSGLQWAPVVIAGGAFALNKKPPVRAPAPPNPIRIEETAAGIGSTTLAAEESGGLKALAQKGLSALRGTGPAAGAAIAEDGAASGTAMAVEGAAMMTVLRWAVPLGAAAILAYEIAKKK